MCSATLLLIINFIDLSLQVDALPKSVHMP